MISRSPLEELAAELGADVARIEREVQLRVTAALSTIEVRLAAVDAKMAELRAAKAESDLRAQNAERALAEAVAVRLAELKDGEPGPIGPQGPPGESVKGDKGDPGQNADPEEIGRIITQHVAAAFATVRVPQDGENADPALIAEMVAAAVAKVTPALPDSEEIRALVVAEVERSVKSLPAPADGHTPTEAELAPLIDAAVSRAVAALPKAKGGEDGKSVEPAEVERMVAAAVAELPPAEPGAPGKTAYQLAAEAGFDGDQATWLGSLRGPQGPQGVKGEQGESIKGEQGERGEDGAPGMLPIVKTWADGVTYAGEVKTHNGALWQAICDTGTAPGADDWICLAMSGRSLRPRGLWGADAEYRYLDLVQRDGATFMALRDDPGPCPGDGWQLVARQGKAGQQGPKGDRGDQGMRGLSGVGLADLYLDDDKVLVAVLTDGTKKTVDFYPTLEETQRGVAR